MRQSFFAFRPVCDGARVRGLAFAIFCALMSSVRMTAEPLVTYIGLPGSGIELAPASSTEFTAALNASIDPSLLPLLQPLPPFGAIIKNGTSERLILVGVRFYLKGPDGRNAASGASLQTSGNPSMNTLGPGALVLITPGAGALVLGPRRGSGGGTSGVGSPKILANRAELYGRQAEIDVTLDCVIFADGGVIGPDAGRHMDDLNGLNRAKSAITSDALDRSGPAIREYLLAMADTPIPQATAPERGDRVEERIVILGRGYARMLLTRLDSCKTEGEFRDFLQQLVKSQTSAPVFKRRQ